MVPIRIAYLFEGIFANSAEENAKVGLFHLRSRNTCLKLSHHGKVIELAFAE